MPGILCSKVLSSMKWCHGLFTLKGCKNVEEPILDRILDWGFYRLYVSMKPIERVIVVIFISFGKMQCVTFFDKMNFDFFFCSLNSYKTLKTAREGAKSKMLRSISKPSNSQHLLLLRNKVNYEMLFPLKNWIKLY